MIDGQGDRLLKRDDRGKQSTRVVIDATLRHIALDFTRCNAPRTAPQDDRVPEFQNSTHLRYPTTEGPDRV